MAANLSLEYGKVVIDAAGAVLRTSSIILNRYSQGSELKPDTPAEVCTILERCNQLFGLQESNFLEHASYLVRGVAPGDRPRAIQFFREYVITAITPDRLNEKASLLKELIPILTRWILHAQMAADLNQKLAALQQFQRGIRRSDSGSKKLSRHDQRYKPR